MMDSKKVQNWFLNRIQPTGEGWRECPNRARSDCQAYGGVDRIEFRCLRDCRFFATLTVGDTVSMQTTRSRKSWDKTRLGIPASIRWLWHSVRRSLDEEVRNAIPRPPLPEINQARKNWFRYEHDKGSRQGGSTSTEYGIVLRADITRIYGTYWNLNGYWRGAL